MKPLGWAPALFITLALSYLSSMFQALSVLVLNMEAQSVAMQNVVTMSVVMLSVMVPIEML